MKSVSEILKKVDAEGIEKLTEEDKLNIQLLILVKLEQIEKNLVKQGENDGNI